MQSWIRDLIDLKTQISVLQNCMHAASQQPCTASQPLQGCRQCEPWTAAAAPIDPATAWPNGLLRQRAGYLRLLPHPVSRPGSSQIDRTSAPGPGTLLYKCTSGFNSVLSACGARAEATACLLSQRSLMLRVIRPVVLRVDPRYTTTPPLG